MFTLFFMIITFDGFDMVMYGATMPVLLKEFHMTPTQAGLIGSCGLIGAGAGALAFGFLADRIGRKKVIILCTIFFSVGSLLSGFSTTMTTFGFFRFIMGLGLGGVMPNIVSLTTEYAPNKNKAVMVAAIFSGMQVGGILASGLSIWLLKDYGFEILYMIGGFPLLLLPLLIKFLPESTVNLIKNNRIETLRNICGKLQPTINLPKNVSFELDNTEKSSLPALFREKRGVNTILIWIVFFMNMFITAGVSTWLPQLMIKAGFGLSFGLLFLLTLNLGALFGSNIAGFVVGRIGYKKTLVSLYLLAFVSITLLGFTTNLFAVLTLVALAGIGFFGGQNIANGYLSLFYPPSMRSTGMGFAFGLGRFGAIFAPTILGFIVSWGLHLYVSFLAVSIPGLIAACIVLLIQEKKSDLQTSKTTKMGDPEIQIN